MSPHSWSLFVAGVGFLVVSDRLLPQSASAAARRTVLLTIAASAALGASLGCALLHPGLDFRAFGWSHDGGVALAAISAICLSWSMGWPVLRTLDAIAPGAAFSMAIIRVGCSLEGCCAGVPSDVPWAVTWHASGSGGALLGQLAPEMNVRIHPTQAYEGLVALLAFTAALLLFRRRSAPGTAAFAYLAILFSFRVFNFQLRQTDSLAVVPPWVPSAALAILGIIGLVAIMSRSRSAPQYDRPPAEHAGRMKP